MPDVYGNARPGEPGYDPNKPLRGPNTSTTTRQVDGKGGSYENTVYDRPGGASPGGEFDPARDGTPGNQAGYGTGSKFMNDLETKLMGGYNPQQLQEGNNVGVNMGPGIGAAAQSGAATRDMQMKLLQDLQDQAAGKGPSLAQMQLQRGAGQNMANAMALGASQRGAGQAGMLKGIANQQARIGQGMTADSAMLRLQEQMQARTSLQGGISQNNQNDQFNAGQTNQMSVERQRAAMEAEKLRQETHLAYERMKAQAAQANSVGGQVGMAFGAAAKFGGGE